MNPTSLPFEYPFRWRNEDLTKMAGVTPEAAALLEQRDRDLEDYLGSLDDFLFPDWTPYTPVWSTDEIQPAIGNGLSGGSYLVVGRLMFVNMFLEMGTTTTYGTHFWRLSLPAGWGVTDPGGTGARQVLSGIIERPTSLIRCPAIAKMDTGSTGVNRIGYPRMNTGTGQPTGAGTVDGANPFAWTAGDSVALNGILNVVQV